MTTLLKTAVLYCQEGSSDKEYQITLQEAGDGYEVVAYAGPRGRATNRHVKSGSAPVELAKAEKVFAGLLREKTSKGYVLSEDAGSSPVVIAPQTSRPDGPKCVTGGPKFVTAMLLNEIDENHARGLLRSPMWAAEMKLDGERIQLHRSGSTVTGYSKKENVRALSDGIVQAALSIAGDYVLDGELVDGSFYPFDVLYASGQSTVSASWETRQIILHELVGSSFQICPAVVSEVEKFTMWDTLRATGAEGIVFKLRSAEYQHGKPNSGGDALKFKFVATASVIVGQQNGEKRSVYMHLADGTEVGKVTIPVNKAIPAPGTIIEVRYLYARRGGDLIQAVYLCDRTDVDREECIAAQFQYKGEPRENQ